MKKCGVATYCLIRDSLTLNLEVHFSHLLLALQLRFKELS